MQKIFSIYIQIGAFFKNLFSSVLSLAKVFFLSKFFLKIPKANLPKAAILGNGPSLRSTIETDLAFIKTTEMYAVNLFAASPAFLQLQPQNYVLLDPAFFLFNEINNSRIDIKKTIDSLIKDTHWSMTLFAPQQFRNCYLVRQIKEKNKNINFSFFNYVILEGFSWFRHSLFNLNLGTPQCQNIMVCALFLAIRRQHESVYLFGADHSWHEEIRVSETNDIEVRQVHFYDNEAEIKHQKVLDVNTNAHSDLKTSFLSLYKVFYGYGILKQYAASKQVSVYNASKKSYIDSFERVKIVN